MPDNTTLPPAGDMSIDPIRDQPRTDGGERYLNWNLAAAFERADSEQTRMLISLGAAVVTRWADLPRDVQKSLFDAAAGSASADAREKVARFLHKYGER